MKGRVSCDEKKTRSLPLIAFTAQTQTKKVQVSHEGVSKVVERDFIH